MFYSIAPITISDGIRLAIFLLYTAWLYTYMYMYTVVDYRL